MHIINQILNLDRFLKITIKIQSVGQSFQTSLLIKISFQVIIVLLILK